MKQADLIFKSVEEGEISTFSDLIALITQNGLSELDCFDDSNFHLKLCLCIITNICNLSKKVLEDFPQLANKLEHFDLTFRDTLDYYENFLPQDLLNSLKNHILEMIEAKVMEHTCNSETSKDQNFTNREEFNELKSFTAFLEKKIELVEHLLKKTQNPDLLNANILKRIETLEFKLHDDRNDEKLKLLENEKEFKDKLLFPSSGPNLISPARKEEFNPLKTNDQKYPCKTFSLHPPGQFSQNSNSVVTSYKDFSYEDYNYDVNYFLGTMLSHNKQDSKWSQLHKLLIPTQLYHQGLWHLETLLHLLKKLTTLQGNSLTTY